MKIKQKLLLMKKLSSHACTCVLNTTVEYWWAPIGIFDILVVHDVSKSYYRQKVLNNKCHKDLANSLANYISLQFRTLVNSKAQAS